MNAAAADANLTQCDLEPITRLERIQSFGFLLAMSSDWTVMRASANLEEFLGVEARAAIGQLLDSFVDREALHDLRNRLTGLSSTTATERLYGITLVVNRAALDLAVHYAGNLCILEGELAGLDSRVDAASLVRKMLALVTRHSGLEEFHGESARQIRIMTGFDRVMIYRFQASGAGEVIAESAGAKANDRFLGLHFPAMDIPAQARALYLRNCFRIIADVADVTAPLLGMATGSGTPLDLSLAMTRAVSPVHIDYLRNMHVAASLSISIIVDGALWGLVACHHHTARLPTYVVRTAAELFGQMYSMTLESRLRKAQDAEEVRHQAAIDQLLGSIRQDNRLLTRADWLLSALRPVIPCDGIAVSFGGRLECDGTTVTLADIATLGAAGCVLPEAPVFATDTIASHETITSSDTLASGVICIPLSRVPGDYILLFRRELLHEIRWAGNPTKTATLDGDRLTISPRKSFAVFTESIAGRSRSFTGADRRAAEALRAGFQNISHRNAVPTDAAHHRVTERQELLIAELNHRVRNVLALIRGLISQTHGEDGNAASYVKSLNGRVQALARAHDRVTRQNWGPGPLNAIFDDELAAYLTTRRDRFTLIGTPVFLHPQAFSSCALIIHEMVTNSSKYGSLSANGRVEVTIDHHVGSGLYIHWREIDGPVVNLPTRRGFGSVIIERVIPFDLQGTAAVRYLPTGIEARFFIPERHIASNPLGNGAAARSDPDIPSILRSVPPRSRPLVGLKVLLLEDNLIVALEAEDLLKSLGASQIFTASTLASASEVLETEKPQFAVLDINLGLETSLQFGGRLRDAGVPFIFTSGYGERLGKDDPARRAITVSKPYDRDQLGSAIIHTLHGVP